MWDRCGKFIEPLDSGFRPLLEQLLASLILRIIRVPTGSLIAASLARLGVQQLTLIDPDRVEAHNIAEMDCVTARDIGALKVTVIAAELARIHGDELPHMVPLPRSVFQVEALAALKEADFLVCCVDAPRARRAVDFVARLFLKPVLDIGAAVLVGGDAGVTRIGADVRLVSPGRCLHCFGGIRDAHQRASAQGVQGWQGERAGSLRSLNQIAVGVAVRLLEEYIAGRLNANTWLQIDFTPSGLPSIRTPEPAPALDCPVCDIAGRGDRGFHLFGPVISEATPRA